MKMPSDRKTKFGRAFLMFTALADFNSSITKLRDKIGPKSEQLSALWRRKQLEYSWLRTLMGKHTDFDQITAAALDFSLSTLRYSEQRAQK